MAALDPVARRAAPARQQLSRAQRGNRAATSSTSRPNWCSTAARCQRPVNYGLVRIVPPEGREDRSAKRPFIVVDPRAGHGPGIGGMKQDSEIGVALAAGHPCYFVGFLPEPMPGQTIEDVCDAPRRVRRGGRARAIPDAEGKPVRDRQLPGRLADHDDGGDPSRPARADHAGRLAAVLLGRRARQEPDALSRAACSAAPG